MMSLLDELPEDEKHPPNIVFEDEALEVAFHPTEQIIAVGLISGSIELYRYTDDGNVRTGVLNHHKKSCRALQFSENGSVLFSGSSDNSLRAVNMETQQVFYKEIKAHSEPINCLIRLSESALASGDDSGNVKLWDLRQRKAVRDYDAQEDFVSDMVFVEAQNTLLVASGDGSLAVYDVRQNKPVARSDQLDDELLSIAIMKNGNKVVCGSQDGILDIYSWGQWADVSDRFPGHPSSVDTLVPIDDQILLTGSSDGLIRVVMIHPNEFAGVVGEHADFPIERIRLSPSHRYLASCSHDCTVKFWNIEYLYDPEDNEDNTDDAAQEDNELQEQDSMDVDESEESDQKKRRGRPKKKEKAQASNNFFADL